MAVRGLAAGSRRRCHGELAIDSAPLARPRRSGTCCRGGVIVIRNLEICFPELDPRARLALARRSFESVAISVAEIAIAWFGNSLPPVRIEGRELLEAALAKGKGVILFSGHFTTLELTAQFVKPLTPQFAFMFRTRSNPLLDAMQAAAGSARRTCRSTTRTAAPWCARYATTPSSGTRPIRLMAGAGAELLPFFGEPAMTNTATTRLARMSGAVVLPFQFRRLDDGSGYLVCFEPPVAGVPSDDATADTMRLDRASSKRFVRACPEQY